MIARAKKRKSPQLKEDKFHIIVNKKDKMLIDNAASILGLDVPAFMLESALMNCFFWSETNLKNLVRR